MTKLRIAAVIFFSAALAGCSPGREIFELSFVQDGKAVKADGDRVMLKKAPFTVLIRMNRPMGALLNFQPDERFYKMANSGKDFYEPGYAMAEYDLNPEKNFLITPDTFHYWYYKDSKENRFDAVKRSGGWYECAREIENYGLQGDARNYPITALPHGRLYLVAFSVAKKDGGWRMDNVKALRLVFY